MLKTACLFPGQGAQYVGMGKSLYENCPEAKEMFVRADQILGLSLSNICFNGPEERLTDTANAQAAIFVTSMAAWAVLKARLPQFAPMAVSGLSLGEFTALVAAESLSFEEGLKLVRKRGELMTEAARENPGTMASLLGLTAEQCQQICDKSGAGIANINSPTQIVISGTLETVQKACRLAEKQNGKAMMLKVSGAFHSKLMASAQQGLKDALNSVTLKSPKVKFVPNVLGTYIQDPAQIKLRLYEQVTSSVQWVKTMETLNQDSIEQVLEIGPGKVLKGLAKRNQLTASVINIETDNDIQQLVKELEGKVC
ncbi:MAG: [acyl-carrier-protein] S-malonyltransferase [Candidatus Omnitrophica bacterium CG11_big_fil_rev_8_21_14_0_20_45_26]|uniref:Malonyl CoA-acyl carrier protein transacylase n=1 Tax=Candidatus Abzuiibacterium crystallinum TaxID=1974748 RepID=A0A2H0LS79_9BACT|nr:MAG: [acyl-carrier-protein] S-malonyltransferase [Candidatus Omnitrophica bacterium CG11_big_fil_rev_8_21_14_0_20_45_26]PIW65039.1 MAG: [acyl-carrier-protein] S-malonyltransferase [Candidatus Omnitrophica bacterium CG12_big_fil_rev_8_21_14_0_65_45_16]